ncbi:MAG: hypothetical protein HSCHL_1748 [Hydrogenibacillus schlegelii]|uniref:Uncharacterized protein n=1 Tax=Hydrogenibacillus schlegelii TaxID=1484 RepID=A0A2T5GBK7_HYDSH|nr:MAG: hypothetical protein HSCHL_1748 [Hydrogenibacillus schlegelii]
MKKTTAPLSVENHSPTPKFGVEAAIAGLRMFPKHGFDLSFERFVRQSPSPFGFFRFCRTYRVDRGNQSSWENRQGALGGLY